MRKKGFTLLEIIVTMVICSFLFVLGGISYKNAMDSGRNRSGAAVLSAVQLESMRLASINLTAPNFPSNLVEILSIQNLTFTTGDSTNSNTISVRKLSNDEYMYAVKTGDWCWVVLDKYGNTTKWGYSDRGATCNSNNWEPSSILSADRNEPTGLGG